MPQERRSAGGSTDTPRQKLTRQEFNARGQAAIHSPARTEARRQETDRRLREARNRMGQIRVRLQPYVWTGEPNTNTYRCLPGQAVSVIVDEAVDLWDLMAATRRLWASWRPERRRTAASREAVRRAWELIERAAQDLQL